jgi:hypothetical protein
MSTTVPHESQTQIKSDRAALDLWPALGGRCRPEDLRRVQRYARECCDQLDGASRKKVWELTIVDKEGLEPAATRVLREDQMEMLAREGGIDEFVAVELHFVQLWCLNALLHLHRASFKFAKETQIRVANGRPLTICVGAEKRRPVTTIAGTYHVTGGGCYRVFEDSLRLDARPFARWCPDCRGRKTRIGKRQALALADRHKELADLRADQEQNPACSLSAAGTIFFSQLERTNQP